MSRYGRPLNILTDNASQFRAEYEATLDALGIRNDKIHPYSHEENAIVERVNKEVLRHLRDMLYDSKIHSKWTDHLPAIQRIKNSTRVESTGMAPADLVFGTSSRLEAGVLYPHQSSHKAGPMHEYIRNQHEIQLQALLAAYRHQDRADSEHLAAAPATQETEFDINSFVLVQYENNDQRPPTKIHPKLRGPYQVISVHRRDNRGTIYTCQNLANNKLEDFYVKLLQPFHYDARYVDPAVEALVDSQAFIVEDILDHVFEGKKQIKTEMKFLVKWLGYEQPTWEPYANLAKLKQLHAYLRNNHLERYIQDAFRIPKERESVPVMKRRPTPAEEEGSRHSNRQRKERKFDD
jgi:hypothetical protein